MSGYGNPAGKPQQAYQPYQPQQQQQQAYYHYQPSYAPPPLQHQPLAPPPLAPLAHPSHQPGPARTQHQPYPPFRPHRHAPPAAPAPPAGPQGGKDTSKGKAKDHPPQTTASGKKVVHPVKNACLNCRSRKMKCTGEQPICLNCSKKGIVCEYVKSKRGGARKRKVPLASSSEDPLALFLAKMTDLASFKASSDPSLDLAALAIGTGKAGGGADDLADVVRTYESMDQVIKEYHEIIYAYLPILPSPGSVSTRTLVEYLSLLTSPFTTSTASSSSSSSSATAPFAPGPLALAFLAILVLHPTKTDPNPQSTRSKAARKHASEAFSKRALDEIDKELDRVGEEGGEVGLDVVQALICVVTWEFAEKGNMLKMRLRQGHALQLAMDLGLHRSDKDFHLAPAEEWKRDMRRRTWWIAFAQLCQASVLSGVPPSLAPFDPRITAEFPVCTLDPELWPNQMGAIRHISRVFQLIIQSDFPDAAAPDAVSSSVLSPGALSDPDEEKERLEGVHREMIALDRKVLLSLKELEKKSVREVKKGMGPEEHMAHNFQTSTLMSLSTCEIALHRRAAFPEVAFFSKKLCGLPSLSSTSGPFGTSSAGRTPISPAQLVESARILSAPPSSTASSFAPLPTMSDSGTPQSVDFGPGGFGHGGVQGESPAVGGVWGSEHVQEADLPVAIGWTPTPNPESKESLGGPYASGPTHSQHRTSYPMSSSSSGGGQPYPRSSMDFDMNAPFGHHPASTPHAPVVQQPQPHQPWFASATGATSMVYSSDVNPYAALLGADGSPGYGFLPDQWAPPAPPTFDAADRYALNMADLQPYYGAYPEQPALPPPVQPPPSVDYSAYAPHPQSSSAAYGTVPPPPVVQPQPVSLSQSQTSLSAGQQSQSAATSTHSGSPSHSTSSVAPSVKDAKDKDRIKPWGLDESLKPVSRLVPSPANQVARLTPAERLNAEGEEVGELLKSSDVPDGPFPPGLSLERCSAAAHSIVRLETLQRTAAFTLLEGPVRALPFCACGLMASAYCFLLLALAIQAGESFDPRALAHKQHELDGLYTNVRIILAGLAKYAEIWDGLANLAQEVKDALDAAINLSADLQQKRLDKAAADEDDDDEDDMSDAEDFDCQAQEVSFEYAEFSGWQT